MAREYAQIEVLANVDDLPQIWDAAQRLDWKRLPALTILFSNVPIELAPALMSELRDRDYEPLEC